MFIGTGGMNVTVNGNTHLAGAVIESKADSALNTLRTKTLTTADIENKSELKTRAVNAGTNMNPMQLMQNLLGNRDEESTTLTKAAIGENIQVQLTDDPNATATLAHLNRDTANANQKVTKHDLNKIEEQKEVAQVIGDISANTVKMYTYNEQQKVEKARLEQGKIQAELEQAGKSEAEIAKDSRYQAATEALDTAQNEYDKAYGTGSTFHRVTTAVTAAVQAAATGDNRQAVVNLASPFLNQVIKEATTDPNTKEVDKVANAIAHAVLGAVEAQVTNKNVLAGAAAGAGGEVAATYLTQVLYPNKKPEELSEAEKQQVVFLSQLAGGLAAGLVGDSSVEAASGADISRRAVENNYLKANDIERWVSAFEKADTEEKKQALLEKLSTLDDKLLVEVLETRISKKELIKRREDLIALQNTENCNAQCRDIATYSIEQLNNLLPNYDKWYAQKWEDNRVNVGISLLTYGAGGIITNGLTKYLPQLADKPVLIAGGFGGGSQLVEQLIEKDGDISNIDGVKVGISTAVGVITKDMGWMGGGRYEFSC